MIEAGLRIFFEDRFPHPKGLYETDDKRGHKLAENFRGVFVDEQNRYVAKAETNSIGLRDYEYGEKGKNIFRILVLGDSFTFGVGVEMEDTYPKQLEKILRLKDNGKRYEVINSGVIGYGTDQEFYYLKEWGLKLKPDLVIVGFYIQNDMPDVMIGALNHYTVRDGYLFDLFSYNQEKRSKNFLEKHSRVYEFMEDRIKKLFVKMGLLKPSGKGRKLPLGMKFYLKKYPPDIENTMEKTKRFLEEIDLFSRQIGGKSLILLIPDRKQVFPEMWIKELRRCHENINDYYITRVNKELANFSEENKIPLLDLLTIQKEYYDKTKSYFFLPADPHWNKEGHKLCAETIYDFLISKQMIP